MRSKQIAGKAGALALAGCCAAAVLSGVATADPTPAPAPGPKTSFDGNGTFAVGTDIVPGTYSSPGPVEGQACYWKRVSGDKIVDNAMSKKPQIVQIDASDTSFKTSDCQNWQKIDDCLPGCAPAGTNPGDILGQLGRIVLSNPGAKPGA